MSEYRKNIVYNKRAKFEYEILNTYEAGIMLKGSEVKSIRQNKVSINEAHGNSRSDGLYVYNLKINEYREANIFNHEPNRPKKLLLKKREIQKLLGAIKEKGQTLIVTSLYINHKNLVKLEIALAKGKNLYDKRETIKQREWDREKQRVIKNKEY